MSNQDILIRLYNELSQLKQIEIIESKTEETTQHAIYNNVSYFPILLQRSFREAIRVVEPLFPSNQFSRIEKIWYYHISKIAELKALERGNLNKPIVAAWYNQNIQVENKGNEYTSYNMIVILPKHYTTCLGLSLNNQSELIFVKFSKIDEYLAKMVKSMLITKDTNELGFLLSTVSCLSIEPTLITDSFSIVQECSDIGWWTVHIACMIIMTGSATSLNEFTTKSISAIENKIRCIFKDLGLLAEVFNQIKEINHLTMPIDSPCYSTKTVFPIKDECKIVTSRSDVIGILNQNGRFADKLCL